MPVQRLIPLERRVAALVTVAVAAIVVALLAVLLHGKQRIAIEDSITRWIYVHFRSPWLAHALLNVSEPTLVVGVLGSLAIGALLRRAWNVAAFAVLGPTVAVLVSELALKSLVHRQIGGANYPAGNAFPSGHETAVVGLVTVLAVLTLRMGWHVGVEIAIVAALGLWALAAALGLVRNFVHYPSDTVGGAGVGVAIVLATALVIDVVVGALAGHRRPSARGGSTPKHVANRDRPS